MNSILHEKGLRVAYTYNPNVRSVCWGVFVGVGSSHETAATSGLSHLVEHMCFKGTPTRTAFDISRETDAMGVNINAFTSKEMTGYYVQCIDSVTERAVEILADLVLHSTFDPAELEKEKQVVLEEIAMSEDAPDDVAGDLASEAFWGQDSLARPIIGTKENVEGFTQADLRAHVAAYYVRDNVVLSVTGHIEEAEVRRLVDAYFDFPEGGRVPETHVAPREARQCSKQKDVEQCNVIVAFDGLPRGDDNRFVLRVFDMILGGGMSSILFQRVREEQGLVYSIYSYGSHYVGRGSYCIYLGTTPAKLQRAMETVAEIIRELVADGVTDEQVERGRSQALSNCVFATESGMAVMRAQARSLLFRNKAFDVDADIAAIEAVTREEVNALIRRIFAAPPAVGMVAKEIIDCKGYFDGE